MAYLKVCLKHPRAVTFDEQNCPACTAISEFMEMTDPVFKPAEAFGIAVERELTPKKKGGYDLPANRGGD